MFGGAMVIVLALLFGLFLAYANGSNDNFKGVATLYGSKTATYKEALAWASIAQILGSLASLVLAHGLLVAFSGKGLVPDAVVGMKSFVLAVGLAASLTVLLATFWGLPVSTTHALIGSLVGAGLLASHSGVNWSRLDSYFFAPLLVSPAIAVVLSCGAYPLFKSIARRAGIKKETCLCVGTELVPLVASAAASSATLAAGAVTATTGTNAECVERYSGKALGVDAHTAVSTLHYLSGSSVCFARALNDTPKIAAILMVGQALAPSLTIPAAAAAMAMGGLLNSRKVAETTARKVTGMDGAQGFSANLVTSFLVIFASKLGLPVSTTHVSLGSLFGIGMVTKQAKWRTISTIVAAWVLTLPVAAALSMGLFSMLNHAKF